MTPLNPAFGTTLARRMGQSRSCWCSLFRRSVCGEQARNSGLRDERRAEKSSTERPEEARFCLVLPFGVGPMAQDSTSCKISREVTKRQVNKVKTMNMYLL